MSPFLNTIDGTNRYWTLLVIFVLVAVGGIRTWNWYHRSAFWHDEAALAMNVVDRPWTRLADAPERNQVAPLGFIALTKAVETVGGPSDRVLRAVPLVGSLIGLWLIYQLGS